eukprot:TRINITY_DN1439_c3_g1_i1.p1 TRINITY_DN1439_c3_g1~~TRINITY_DN1439_c3_g1_i1.p1  ORF type:complete len:289 (-),score=117.34 TRINITY_DN1439_c3_g1_i1:50-916(-)
MSSSTIFQLCDNPINSNFKCIHFKSPNLNSSAIVQLYGAQITSYKVNNKELIFVSSKAIFREKEAIRGGIPICWPQFGPGSLPNHGFARISTWELVSQIQSPNSNSVTLQLCSNETTLNLWPFKFTLHFVITLENDNLQTELRVINNESSSAFTFTVALHTYFLIDQILNVSVNGLQGLEFIDKVKGNSHNTEINANVSINSETDRIYINAPNQIQIQDTNQNVILEKENLTDVVVWNPWADKAKAMKDFDDNEYNQMICVETGTITNPINLQPNQTWIGKQKIYARL